ncbi:hypothetical protein N6L27_10380 [Leisingera sp. SS27]|uniref:hypothetical protein n=1 Tax=Leisingera sp. SS27 TaxID=2979462 RepID=UPI0017D223AD|nr:hypothetical protein [Leisingera sp. SS27]MDC0658402.1 hypothetical protein [Leisingera sp. SS27]NVK15942.1 hypothetical protein [Paracoccaceae bacterium]
MKLVIATGTLAVFLAACNVSTDQVSKAPQSVASTQNAGAYRSEMPNVIEACVALGKDDPTKFNSLKASGFKGLGNFRRWEIGSPTSGLLLLSNGGTNCKVGHFEGPDAARVSLPDVLLSSLSKLGFEKQTRRDRRGRPEEYFVRGNDVLWVEPKVRHRTEHGLTSQTIALRSIHDSQPL